MARKIDITARRPHQRRNGREISLKRPDAKRNARPPKIHVKHGNLSAILNCPFDKRTRFGKAYYQRRQLLIDHIGTIPTPPQLTLIDQATRLGLLADLSWAEILNNGKLTTDKGVIPAFTGYLKVVREQAKILQILGIKPHEIEVPALDDYLEANYSEEIDGEVNQVTE